MKKIIISACLAGDLVRYDERRVPIKNGVISKLCQKGLIVKVCPEISGGLKVPRLPAQIVNGDGLGVLKGTAKVVDIQGNDVTTPFIKGAEYTLSLAKKNRVGIAILKEKSPSCGVRHIYNGQFDSTLIPGSGVTAAILQQHNIKVFSENETDEVQHYLEGYW